MTPTPETAARTKVSRVLACDRCYRRKIKCTKTFPCSHCVEVGSPCIPVATRTNVRQRVAPKKQDLLQRLQHCEMLLQQNGIHLERSPRHVSRPYSISGDTALEFRLAQEPSQNAAEPRQSEKLNIWQHTPVQRHNEIHDADAEPDPTAGTFTDDHTMQRAMDRLHRDNHDHLLFFAPNPSFDVQAQHPPPGQLLKLWQVYQDHIDPLLKVTHTPTLQLHIIDVIGNPRAMETALEALLFGIYSVAVMSLEDEECSTILGSTYSRADVLNQYQIACQQALLRCGFLRSDSRDCLTALYLYVLSIKSMVDRRSLCSFMGSAFRIAQRMELHSEAKNAKQSVFEAEMRRRLWWSLVTFDAHICESSNNLQSANLIPTWDCKPPSNINDFELRPDMKSHPASSDRPTQATYVVMRSIIVQCLRHSDFQLAFINPILERFGKRVIPEASGANGEKLTFFERLCNLPLFEHLDPNIPLRRFTILTTQVQIARARLLDRYFTQARCKELPTNEALNAATSDAIQILECGQQLTQERHLHGFQWHISRFYFPAYVHILKDLRGRPMQPSAERAWDIMSETFHARLEERPSSRENPVMRLFANLVLDAWDARVKSAASTSGSRLRCPRIISDVRFFLPSTDPSETVDAAPLPREFDLDYFLPAPMELSDQYLLDDASSDFFWRDLGLDLVADNF